jgi:hypothetical protein
MQILKYPLQTFEDDYDCLQIDSLQYRPPGLGSNDSAPFRVGNGNDSNRNTVADTSIFLPMPLNIADGNSANWESDRLNSIDAFLGRKTLDTINTFNLEEEGSVTDKIGTVAAGIPAELKTVMDSLASSGNSDAVKSYLAGQIVNIARNVDAQSIIGRTTGKVMNPNIELLFRSVDLRSFTYQFDFTPRSEDEGQMVKNIIRTFKKDSAAKRGGLFISSPNVFRLQFRRGREKHPFLNNFKICALKSVQVDYTSGTGGYKVYSDSTPVKMSMSLSFTELTPVYDDDFDSNAGGVGF